MNEPYINETEMAPETPEVSPLEQLAEPVKNKLSAWVYVVLGILVVSGSLSALAFLTYGQEIRNAIFTSQISDSKAVVEEESQPIWNKFVDKNMLVTFDIPSSWDSEIIRHPNRLTYHPLYVRLFSPETRIQKPPECKEESIDCLTGAKPIEGAVIHYFFSKVGDEIEQAAMIRNDQENCTNYADVLKCEYIQLAGFDTLHISYLPGLDSPTNHFFTVRLGEYNLMIYALFSEKLYASDPSPSEIVARLVSSFDLIENTNIQTELSYTNLLDNLDAAPFLTELVEPLDVQNILSSPDAFCDRLLKRGSELGVKGDLKCSGNELAWAVEVPYYGSSYCMDSTFNRNRIGSYIEGSACVPHEYTPLPEDPNYYEFYYSLVRPLFIETFKNLAKNNYLISEDFCSEVEANFGVRLPESIRSTSSVSCIHEGNAVSIETQYKDLFSCSDNQGRVTPWQPNSVQDGSRCAEDGGAPYTSSEDIFYQPKL